MQVENHLRSLYSECLSENPLQLSNHPTAAILAKSSPNIFRISFSTEQRIYRRTLLILFSTFTITYHIFIYILITFNFIAVYALISLLCFSCRYCFLILKLYHATKKYLESEEPSSRVKIFLIIGDLISTFKTPLSPKPSIS